MDAWQLRKHVDYDRIVARYTYAMDAFTGEAHDKALATVNPLIAYGDLTAPAGTYLYRKVQGEHTDNFAERARISRYPMHMQSIVAAFIGGLLGVEGEAKREWGKLGDPDDDATWMARMWRDVDGTGTDWPTRIVEIARALTVWHEVYYMVLPPPTPMDMPQWVLIPPPTLRNWLMRNGALVEAVLDEEVDARSTLQDDPTKAESRRLVHFYPEGFARYESDKDRVTLLDDQSSLVWPTPIYSDQNRTDLRLPIGSSRLAMDYHVGLRIAQGNVSLYNLLSDARNLIRTANHPMLRGMVDAQAFTKTLEERRKGSNVLMGDWAFISPPVENARVAYDVYQAETRDYYITAFQQYNDAPKERTATETELEDQRGRAAFLAVLSKAVDEVENDVLFLLSQYMAPSSPDSWSDAWVERSRSFKPIDPEAALDRKVDRFDKLVKTLDVGTSARIAGFEEQEMQEYRFEEMEEPEPEPKVPDPEPDPEQADA